MPLEALLSNILGITFPCIFVGIIMVISICFCECLENYFNNICHFWQSVRMLRNSARKQIQKRNLNKASEGNIAQQSTSLLRRGSSSQNNISTNNRNSTSSIIEENPEDYDPPPSYFQSTRIGIGE